VLIHGPTGTGKELIAKNIYLQSDKKKKKTPYIVVNCAAISKELFESEMFGYRRGRLQGLRATKRGMRKKQAPARFFSTR